MTGPFEIPRSWAWSSLGEIADVIGGVTKDAKRQSDPSFVEVPYLRVANVQRGFLDLSTVATIRVSEGRAEQLELLPGDVLLNEGGDRDKLGRGWIWEGQIPRCIHQNHVFRARIHGGILDPKLLSWHANTFGQQWFQEHGLQSVNLASISLSKIKQLPVPIPPLAEQRRIVATLEDHLSRLDAGLISLQSSGRRLRAWETILAILIVNGRFISGGHAGAELPVGWSRVTIDDLALVGTGATPLRSRKDYYEGGTVPWVTSAMVNKGGVKWS